MIQNFYLVEADFAADRNYPNQGMQILEKMVSGQFIGEVVRNICVDVCVYVLRNRIFCIRQVFGEKCQGEFLHKTKFSTRYVSRILADNSKNFDDIVKFFKEGPDDGVKLQVEKDWISIEGWTLDYSKSTSSSLLTSTLFTVFDLTTHFAIKQHHYTSFERSKTGIVNVHLLEICGNLSGNTYLKFQKLKNRMFCVLYFIVCRFVK